MRFDVYGRFRLEVQRENDSWVVYRLSLGRRIKLDDLIVPNVLAAEEIATFLETTSFTSYPDPAEASSYCRKGRRNHPTSFLMCLN